MKFMMSIQSAQVDYAVHGAAYAVHEEKSIRRTSQPTPGVSWSSCKQNMQEHELDWIQSSRGVIEHGIWKGLLLILLLYYIDYHKLEGNVILLLSISNYRKCILLEVYDDCSVVVNALRVVTTKYNWVDEVIFQYLTDQDILD